MADRLAESSAYDEGGGVIDALSQSFPTRVLRLLTPYAFIIAIVTFLLDLDYKSSDRDAQAWQVITTQAPGNSGKIDALEYLNTDHPLAIPNPRQWGIPLGPATTPVEAWLRGDDGTSAKSEIPKDWILLRRYGPFKTRTPLVGIDLGQKRDANGTWLGAPTYLEGVDLSGAILARADFTAADLANANLEGARLYRAKLPNANLEGADLTNARLTRADLSNTRLVGVNFAGASFKDTDITGADLRGAQLAGALNLVQAQIDLTCTDERTTLPKGLTAPESCEATERGYLIRGVNGLPNRASMNKSK